MGAIQTVSPEVGTVPVCAALGIPRASYYRARSPRPPGEPKRRPAPARALTTQQSEDVLAVLHSLAHRAFPLEHRRQLQSTNPLERLNKGIKRRSAVVGIFPNRAGLLRLVRAVVAEQDDELDRGGLGYFSAESVHEAADTAPGAAGAGGATSCGELLTSVQGVSTRGRFLGKVLAWQEGRVPMGAQPSPDSGRQSWRMQGTDVPWGSPDGAARRGFSTVPETRADSSDCCWRPRPLLGKAPRRWRSRRRSTTMKVDPAANERQPRSGGRAAL
jgi:hypothetical protein